MQKRLWMEYSGSTSWRGSGDTHRPGQSEETRHPFTASQAKVRPIAQPLPCDLPHRENAPCFRPNPKWTQALCPCLETGRSLPGLSGKASTVLCHLPPVFLDPLCPSLANRCVYSQYRKVRSSLYRTAMADDRQIKKTLRVMPSSNGEDRSPLCERRETSSDSEGPDGRAANWKRDISSGWVHVT